MRRTLSFTLIALALAAGAGCSRTEASGEPALAAVHSPDGKLPRLVFFMNPRGQPCQMQDGILGDMRDELEGKVQLVTYRTTSREDLARFDEYGIRSLPTLVLTDATGREVRRATPGIQSAEAIRHLIGR